MATAAMSNSGTVPPPLMLADKAGFTPSTMPGMRKAAILMVTLGEDLAKKMFQSLSEYNVQRVTDEIMKLGHVSSDECTQVLDGVLRVAGDAGISGVGWAGLCAEFADGGFWQDESGGVAVAGEAGAGPVGWGFEDLQKMDPQQLSKFLENEHPQTVALVLAHLDANRASKVLMSLKPAMRVEGVRRLAEMRQFSPEMAQQVALGAASAVGGDWVEWEESLTRDSRLWRSC